MMLLKVVFSSLSILFLGTDEIIGQGISLGRYFSGHVNVFPAGGKRFRKSITRKSNSLCRNDGLNAHQKRLCIKFPLEVVAALDGFREAIDECQYQFRNARWNCNTLVKKQVKITVQPLDTPMMRRGFKEVAFVHALIAAAVAKSVAYNCARGVISSCNRLGSKPPRSKAVSPSKTYDPIIRHALHFSAKFLNFSSRGRDFQGILNKHNLRAGRLTFMKHLNPACKCHGKTGSCTAKSCTISKTSPDLRKIGNDLKGMYDRAKKVAPVNRIGRRKFLPVMGKQKPPSKFDLIYIEKSPTFCDRDDTLGTHGVRGRICSTNARRENSCELMCCGRGYNTHRVILRKRCGCVLIGCQTRCTLKCKWCRTGSFTTSCK